MVFAREGRPGVTACQERTLPAESRRLSLGHESNRSPVTMWVVAGGRYSGPGARMCASRCAGTETTVALVDRAELQSETLGRDIRAWAMSAGSKRLLDVLGVWGELAEHANPVTAVDITDSSLNDAFRPVLVSYDNRVEGDEPATYILESQRPQLGAAAGRAGTRVDNAAGRPSHRRFRDRRARLPPLIWRAERGCVRRWLAAADGRASRLREMAGIKVVAGAILRSASSQRSGTRSRIAAAPCSIFCRPVRSPSCRWSVIDPA